MIIGAACSLSAFAQIPNNGFENWSSIGGYNVPDSWGNLNSVTSLLSVYTCTKGTPGAAGTAYLKLTSKTVAGMGVVPGIAVTGNIDIVSMKPKGGFPITTRPQSLTGKCQYMYGASPNDIGFMSVTLTKWDANTNTSLPIASGIKNLTGMEMSWADFTIPITYVSSATPDTAMIVLSASGATPSNGSYLYVDNLNFTGTATSVSELNANHHISIFPNPSSQNEIHVSVSNEKIQSIEIMSIEGKLVQQIEVSYPSTENAFDVSTLPSAQYLVKLHTASSVFISKFIKL